MFIHLELHCTCQSGVLPKVGQSQSEVILNFCSELGDPECFLTHSTDQEFQTGHSHPFSKSTIINRPGEAGAVL